MNAQRARVLFVDDEPQVLNTMRWMFQRDYEVTLANGGQQAIDTLSKERFDVIVSDQRMPGISGVEVLREAKRCSPHSMRILLTGYADMRATIDSVNDGEIFRYITKPWVNDELKEIVRLAAETARKTGAYAKNDEPAPADGAKLENILVIDAEAQTTAAIRELMGDLCNVEHASSADQALDLLEGHEFGVLVSNTRLGTTDVTALIKLLKAHHPEIVTLVVSDQADAYLVMDLINQGQIFRFLKKPILSGQCRLGLLAAMQKHRQLKASPELARRHQVEGFNGGGPRITVASRPATKPESQDGKFLERMLSRVSSLPRRLFFAH